MLFFGAKIISGAFSKTGLIITPRFEDGNVLLGFTSSISILESTTLLFDFFTEIFFIVLFFLTGGTSFFTSETSGVTSTIASCAISGVTFSVDSIKSSSVLESASTTGSINVSIVVIFSGTNTSVVVTSCSLTTSLTIFGVDFFVVVFFVDFALVVFLRFVVVFFFESFKLGLPLFLEATGFSISSSDFFAIYKPPY